MDTFNCNQFRVHRPHEYPAHSVDGVPDGIYLHCPGLSYQDIQDATGDRCRCGDLDCPCDGGTVKAGHHRDPSVQSRPTAHDAYEDGVWEA